MLFSPVLRPATKMFQIIRIRIRWTIPPRPRRRKSKTMHNQLVSVTALPRTRKRKRTSVLPRHVPVNYRKIHRKLFIAEIAHYSLLLASYRRHLSNHSSCPLLPHHSAVFVIKWQTDLQDVGVWFFIIKLIYYYRLVCLALLSVTILVTWIIL